MTVDSDLAQEIGSEFLRRYRPPRLPAFVGKQGWLNRQYAGWLRLSERNRAQRRSRAQIT